MSVVVKHLTKYYGTFKALENLSFEIRPGEVVGLLGPNAGKIYCSYYSDSSAFERTIRFGNILTKPVE